MSAWFVNKQLHHINFICEWYVSVAFTAEYCEILSPYVKTDNDTWTSSLVSVFLTIFNVLLFSWYLIIHFSAWIKYYTTLPSMSHVTLFSFSPSLCSLRSGPVRRAVLAAPGASWQKAGLRGKSGLTTQHWLRRSCSCRSLQDGVPSGGQVRK